MSDTADNLVYELTLELDESVNNGMRVEANTADSVQLRCSVNGEVHENPELSWVLNGQLVHGNQQEFTVVKEESSEKSIRLNIDKFSEHHVGYYECQVRRPTGKVQKAVLNLELKHVDNEIPLLNEVPCSADWAEYCLNGGSCYSHTITQIKSCRCRHGTYGDRCAYISIRPPQISYENKERSGIDSSVLPTVVGALVFSSLFLVILCLAICYCRRRKERENSKDDNYDEESSPTDRGRLMETGELSMITKWTPTEKTSAIYKTVVRRQRSNEVWPIASVCTEETYPQREKNSDWAIHVPLLSAQPKTSKSSVFNPSLGDIV